MVTAPATAPHALNLTSTQPSTATATSGPAPTSDFAQQPAQTGDSRTLAATPNVLEVGIPSETHGWLRVRAELNHTGEVTASVLTTSVGAAESLHRDLPALATFLATERVGIRSIVVNSPTQLQDAASTGSSMSQGQGREPGQQSAQSSAEGRATSAFDSMPWLPDDTGMLSPALHTGGALSGGWLSVRV